jgi:hypothetical protein
MDDDGHEVVTLMYDQLDVLEQMVNATECHCHPKSLDIEAWIEDTRKFLPERGKRG